MNDEMKRNKNFGEWVPVSERMPEKSDGYLVTVHPYYIVPGGKQVDILIWEKGRWMYFDDQCRLVEFPDPIIAWMPLPEPYKGGGSE